MKHGWPDWGWSRRRAETSQGTVSPPSCCEVGCLNSLLARRRPGRATSGRVHARANRLTGGSLKTPIPPRDKRRTGRAPHDSAVGTKGAQT
jgi:hypothetical protein